MQTPLLSVLPILAMWAGRKRRENTVFSPCYDNPTLELCGIHHTGLRAKRATHSIFSAQWKPLCLVFVSLWVKRSMGSDPVPNGDGRTAPTSLQIPDLASTTRSAASAALWAASAGTGLPATSSRERRAGAAL